MSEPTFTPFSSGTISARLNPSEHQRLVSIYRATFGESEDKPFRELLIRMIETIENSPAAATDTTDLEHKIFVLEGEKTLLEEKLQEAQRQIVQLERQIDPSKIPAPEPRLDIPAESILITPAPVVNIILTTMSEHASRRFNREITRADILIDHFIQTVEQGPGDYLPLFFSAEKIREIKTKLAAGNE